MRRFVFQDEVLLDNLTTSKDVLNYLKEKKNQLLVYSSLNTKELNKEMEYSKLESLIDIYIPYINEELFNDSFANEVFFHKIRDAREKLKEEILENDGINLDWYLLDPFVVRNRIDESSTVLVSDQITMYVEARKWGIQSIYYEKDKEVGSFRKIKTLASLKNIY